MQEIMIEEHMSIEEHAELYELLEDEQALLKSQIEDMIYEHRINKDNPFFDKDDWQKRFLKLVEHYLIISNTLEKYPSIRVVDPVTKERKRYCIRKVYDREGNLKEVGYSELI